MNDPVKIIWKYKNDYKKIQHHVYIFVGNVPENIDNILEKIRLLDFFESMKILSLEEYAIMENKYGYKWYNKFFNYHHIKRQLKRIKKNDDMKNELINKYTKEWYDNHINIEKVAENSKYNYDVYMKMEKNPKTRIYTATKDDLDVNYKTTNESGMFGGSIGMFNANIDVDNETDTQEGGEQIDEFEEEFQEPDFAEDFPVDNIPEGEDIFPLFENIEELYEDVDIDEHIKDNAKLLQEAIKYDKHKIETTALPFDINKDKEIHDEKLKNTFVKTYVKSNYIFKDDTIQEIKKKITCSIKNNIKFGENSYLLPSRQYLWTDYLFDNKIKKISLGHVWIIKSDLLQIDIEPNDNLKIYENLEGNLKLLKNNMKRYNKFRKDDTETKILSDYTNYLLNNDIYMIDIYNELGVNYDKSQQIISNMQDVYINLYFPKINADNFRDILSYLNGKTTNEEKLMVSSYETLNNDQIAINEIMNEIENEKSKLDKKPYVDWFNSSYITHSVIHVNIIPQKKEKLNIYALFNNFIVDENYPFVQYYTSDADINYKVYDKDLKQLSEDKQKKIVMQKWFTYIHRDLSFKIKMEPKHEDTHDVDKYMIIIINENGRLEYKTSWREENKATMDDVIETYAYVKKLVLKLIGENKTMDLVVPDNKDYAFAFINIIQKFNIPSQYTINHNDLSDFSRFFYPYVTLVLDPKKRKGKQSDTNVYGKYGTYLRYKRISKYNNLYQLKQRMLYLKKKFNITDKMLINEISQNFNISEKQANDIHEAILVEYPNLKKSKNLQQYIPGKFRMPGIEINIQGKHADNYKIKISGSRSNAQFSSIVQFIDSLLSLYVDTYLVKNKDRKHLLEKLQKLNHIAKRRNKVVEIIQTEKQSKDIKDILSNDKHRLSGKASQAKVYWIRECQKSGDMNRRPDQYTERNIDELLKTGYKYNEETKNYEKKIKIKKYDNLLNKEYNEIVTLSAMKVAEYDEDDIETGNFIYYTCSPARNGEYIYVGLLNKSKGDSGPKRPCCYKKITRQITDGDKGDGVSSGDQENVASPEMSSGEILYILQDTNRMRAGRLSGLPKNLNIFFNDIQNKTKKIKTHLVTLAPNGYYFKLGINQEGCPFINALAYLYNKTPIDLRKTLSEFINKNSDALFMSLNSGELKLQYGSKQEYMSMINSSNYIDHKLLEELISLPNVLYKHGVNLIIFEKKTTVIKSVIEKEKVIDDFILDCSNVDLINNMSDPKRHNIILINEGLGYFPIIMLTKQDESTKDITLDYFHYYSPNNDNEIINQLYSFYTTHYNKNKIYTSINNAAANFDTKSITKHLYKMKNEYHPRFQLIDIKNKCTHLVLTNGYVLPVYPSSVLRDVAIIVNLDKYFKSFKDSMKFLIDITNDSNGNLAIQPKGVNYESENKKDGTVYVNAIIVFDDMYMPVIREHIKVDALKRMNLSIKYDVVNAYIDDLLKNNKKDIIDIKMKTINQNNYVSEGYELFRFEFSDFINRKANLQIKIHIESVINGKYILNDKVEKIRSILYYIISKELYNKYVKLIPTNNNVKGGLKHDKFVHLIQKEPNTDKYTLNNIRQLCGINDDKNECNTNFHCGWSSKCFFEVTTHNVINYVNKMSEELAQGNLKCFEIMKYKNAFVSDVINTNYFTPRENQTIIKSSNYNLLAQLENIFGKDTSFKNFVILNDVTKMNYAEVNAQHPLEIVNNVYVQKILHNNITYLRAYSNCIYWLKSDYNIDIMSKNLEYYSAKQTDLAEYFRALIIDWIKNEDNHPKINKDLGLTKQDIHKCIISMMTNIKTINDGKIEFYVLSIINQLPIIIHDDSDQIILIYENGNIIKHHDIRESNKYDNSYVNKGINMIFTYDYTRNIPVEIDALYT